MLHMHQMVRKAVSQIGAKRVILGAAFDLSDLFCEEFLAEGLISGYILNKEQASIRLNHASHAGWWLDRGKGRWQPRHMGPATVLLLGFPADHRIPGDMLLAARLNGIDRIAFAKWDGSIQQDLDVATTLLNRLRWAGDAAAPHDYKSVYALMISLIGDRFRVDAQDIVPNRVVLLTNLAPGGAERQAVYTATGLAQSSEREVIILSDSLEPPNNFYLPQIEAAGVKVVTAQTLAEEFEQDEARAILAEMAKFDHFGFQSIFQAVFHYALALKSLKPYLLHTWLDYNNVHGGIAAQLVGIPTLLLGGRSIAPTAFPSTFQPYMRPAYQTILCHDGVKMVNNSRAGAADYCRWLDLPQGAIKVINNGFDFPAEPLRAARAQVRRELGIGEDAVVVGSILRFSEEKRPLLFAETAIDVLKQRPETQFVAFGDGPLLDATRDFVSKAGVGDAIKLPGLTGDAWASLAAMDIFVLTSRVEGLPNVLIEAQASGLPVVCTGVGGMNETFQEGVTGLAVPEATAEGLARGVLRLIDDVPSRECMAEAAWTFARTTFDKGRMIDETIKTYELLGSR